MPAVSLILPLEGGRERTLRCLEALAALDAEPTFEAILIDDASPDLGELLAGLSGDVKVLRNERRQGFVASAMRGAEAAESEVLVLLRDAAVLAPDALGPLLHALADPEDPKTAGIGSRAAPRPGAAPVGDPAQQSDTSGRC